MESPAYKVAGATNTAVLPTARFVQFDVANSTPQDYAVTKADGAHPIVGISQEGCRRAPGLSGVAADDTDTQSITDVTVTANHTAGNPGEEVTVHGPGHVANVEAAAAIKAGQLVISDGYGRALPQVLTALNSGDADAALVDFAPIYVGGFALMAAAAPTSTNTIFEKCRVFVMPFVIVLPAVEV